MWVRHAREDGLSVGLMAHVSPEQRPPFWLLDVQVAGATGVGGPVVVVVLVWLLVLFLVLAVAVAVAVAVVTLSRHIGWKGPILEDQQVNSVQHHLYQLDLDRHAVNRDPGASGGQAKPMPR